MTKVVWGEEGLGGRGYGMVMRVRTRKGREIGDAKWPRSIVNQSALVADWNLVVRRGRLAALVFRVGRAYQRLGLCW